MYAGDEDYGDEITSPIERPMQQVESEAFEKWLAKLNMIVEDNVGLSLDDLEDFSTRDGYDDGMTPQEFYDDVIAPELDLD